ncbi:MAG: BACON domain-containing protein [Candidatus Cryptobacteroides sp.]
MNFKSLFASVLAFAAIAVACDPIEGELKEASLKLEGETSFTLDSKAQTVEVAVLSTRDWTATSSESWLVVDPASGAASDKAQRVELTVLENTSYDRTATVTFSIGTTTKKVSVTQTGNASAPDGTKENPFNIEYAVAKCIEVGQTASTEKYYVKGLISNIKEIDTGTFGNAIYSLSDDGTTEGNQFTVYRGYYLNGAKFTSADQIKVGDEVIVYCTLVNYSGNTPETGNTGAPIVCLNGEWGDGSEAGGGEVSTEPKGTGTADDPFNAAAAINKCVEIGTTASTETYYVKGIVASIKELDTATYGNATFYISDDGTATDQFYIFRCKYIGGEKFTSADQLKVGQEVVVKGSLVNYYGNTPEMTQGCELVSVEGEGSGSNPDPDPIEAPTEFTEVTIAQFLAAAEDDTWYKVTGQVTNIASEQFGNLTLKDETAEVYIYGVSSKYASSNDQLFNTLGITLGDNLTIAVQRGSYNNNPQGVNGFYISHTEGELDLGQTSDFTKVSGEVSDWTGTYLIMMADGKAHATVSGKDLAATSDVLTETDGVINTFDAYAVTIAQEGEGWSIKLPNGKYLSLAHNSAASSDSPVVFSIENTDAGVKIYAVPSGKTADYYLYYSTNNGEYIRFYVDKTGDERYTLPTLYKK